MGRLIDAEKLYDDLANNLRFIMGDGSDGEAIDTYATIGDIIHDTFDEQPTACDVDAIVEQLEDYGNEECAYYENTPYKNVIVECIGKAIEIMKGGGVDAKTNS